jgi:hypothetical protein
LAVEQQRLLVTFDKDFGELAFRSGQLTPFGVVLFRIRLPSPRAASRRIVGALESRTDWAGHFAVIEDARIRMVPLQRAADEA